MASARNDAIRSSLAGELSGIHRILLLIREIKCHNSKVTLIRAQAVEVLRDFVNAMDVCWTDDGAFSDFDSITRLQGLSSVLTELVEIDKGDKGQSTLAFDMAQDVIAEVCAARYARAIAERAHLTTGTTNSSPLFAWDVLRFLLDSEPQAKLLGLGLALQSRFDYTGMWVVLNILAMSMFFGVLLIRTHSAQLNVTYCLFAVALIALCTYLIGELDSPYQYRVDNSALIYLSNQILDVLTDAKREVDSSPQHPLEEGASIRRISSVLMKGRKRGFHPGQGGFGSLLQTKDSTSLSEVAHGVFGNGGIIGSGRRESSLPAAMQSNLVVQRMADKAADARARTQQKKLFSSSSSSSSSSSAPLTPQTPFGRASEVTIYPSLPPLQESQTQNEQERQGVVISATKERNLERSYSMTTYVSNTHNNEGGGGSEGGVDTGSEELLEHLGLDTQTQHAAAIRSNWSSESAEPEDGMFMRSDDE